jgi:hypothetical protein
MGRAREDKIVVLPPSLQIKNISLKIKTKTHNILNSLLSQLKLNVPYHDTF